MMNKLTKFLHELFNPHCLHCDKIRMEEYELKEFEIEKNLVCQTCEALKLELANAHNLNNKLINNIIDPPKSEFVEDNGPKQVIQTRHLPFSVIKNKLEAESRAKAEKIRQEALITVNLAKPDTVTINSGSITELEQDLGISDARTQA